MNSVASPCRPNKIVTSLRPLLAKHPIELPIKSVGARHCERLKFNNIKSADSADGSKTKNTKIWFPQGSFNNQHIYVLINDSKLYYWNSTV